MPYADPEAKRKYQREWIARNRAKWLAVNGPCVDCGTWDDLEIDHVDRTQKIDHRIWSWSRARRDAELAKCVVRCVTCHLRKSRAAGDQPPPTAHGAKRMYDTYGCRCARCRAAKAASRVVLHCAPRGPDGLVGY